jgi:hypothetical protein
MQRPTRRTLGAALVSVVVVIGLAGCGDDVVSPSPVVTATTSPTVTPSTASPPPSPIQTPRDAIRWSRLLFDEVVPESREMASWTADSSGSAAYLFGGRGADGVLGDLWAYDLAADRWLQLEPSGDAPAPRYGHVAAWIDGLGLVIYGGRSDAALDDMWVYDPEANGWRPQPATGDTPAARWGSCSAVASDGQLWVSHGTASDDASLDDTWRYDPVLSTWTAVGGGADGPSARTGAACWWTDDERFVLFGGRTSDAPAVGDLWAIPAAGGDWVALESVAGAERSDAAVGRTAPAGIAFGGIGPDNAPLGDTVAVDARTTGIELLGSTGDAQPSARRGAVLVDDPGNERMLLSGGWDGVALQDDVWSVDLP